jgi:hypothetical protein
VDVWKLLWNAANHDEASLEKYLTDGLHLNGAGNEVRYSTPFRLSTCRRSGRS